MTLLLVAPPARSQESASGWIEWDRTGGGNGHYYQAVAVPGGIHWADAQATATDSGAYLATLSSSAENAFVLGLVDSADFWIASWNDTSMGPWIGGQQPPGSVEPDGGWTWVTGEPMSYTNWGPGQPNDVVNSWEPYDGQDRAHLWALVFPNRAGTWNDLAELELLASYIMERDTPPRVCGDGIRHPSEACDDGNRLDGDGCRSDCTLEECGDGLVDPGEACDDGNTIDGDGCRSDCTLERCGNGIVDLGEACDDGNERNGDGCRSDCTLERCGDGIVDAGEACDDGNERSGDGCRSDCTVEQCGDGIVDVGEACDDGNNRGSDGCRSDCTVERCGDRIVDLGEACDDGDDIDYNQCRNDCSRPRLGHAASEIVSLPDISGLGGDELAVLRRESIEVTLWNAASAALVQNIVFAANPDVRAVSMAVVADLEGGDASKLAVLAERTNGLGLVDVRECLTARLVSRVKLGRGWEPLDIEVISNLDGSGSTMAAVLARKAHGRRVRVFVFDLESRTQVAKLRFPTLFAPLDLEVVNNLEGGGSLAVAVLARRERSGQVRVITKDIWTSAVMGDWSFSQKFLPLDLEIVPSRIRSHSYLAAVLGEKLNGGGRIFIRSLANGEKVGVARLGRAYRALALEAVPHADPSGSSGLAVLEVGKRHGQVRVSTRRATSGRRLGEARFADLLSVRGMAVVGDIGGSPADEIALLGRSRCANGMSGITLRDASDGLLIQCFPVD